MVEVRGSGPLADALRSLECDLPALVTVAPEPRLAQLATIEPAAWREVFRTWVEEPFWAYQRFARERLAASEPGCWVAVTSNLGVLPFPRDGGTGAAAAALHTVVRIAAVEHGPSGLRANAVAPGWLEGALPAELDDELARTDTPTARLTSAEDVAAAVAFLLSPAADQLNGEIVRLDGGYTITKGSRPGPFAA
jgi:3-oxoacyl-[acyl-carrier protein] reductase